MPQQKKGKKKDQVYFGPSLPEPKPEEIAMQKIKKLENDLAANVLADIQKENPPDWQHAMPRALHPGVFKWPRREPVLPAWNELANRPVEKKKEVKNSIALIAGEYGDSDEEDEEEEEEVVLPAKRKMQMQVKSQSAKQAKTVLKAVPSIFQEEDDDEEEEDGEKQQEEKKKKPEVKEEKRVAKEEKQESKKEDNSSSKELAKKKKGERKVYDSSTSKFIWYHIFLSLTS